MPNFIIIDKYPGNGKYFIVGDWDSGHFDSLSDALKAAGELKALHGGIIANIASADHKSHNQMSSVDAQLGGSNYRV